MSSGLHHPNYAIMTLEKELIIHNEALKNWTVAQMQEYSESWKRGQKQIKELEEAIEKLKK